MMKTVRFGGDPNVRQVGDEWVSGGRRWRIVDGYGHYWLQVLWHVFVNDEHQIRMGFVYHDGYPGPNRAWATEPMSLQTFVGIKKPSLFERLVLRGYEHTEAFCIAVLKSVPRSWGDVPGVFSATEVFVS